MYVKHHANLYKLFFERMVKEFAAAHNTTQIKKLMIVLGRDFAQSKNSNYKKGGLIGLAAMAIALGKVSRNYHRSFINVVRSVVSNIHLNFQDTVEYIEDLMTPILINFSDSDLRVRYFACEALYNVIKVARGAVLPHFGILFQSLSKLASDPDQSVMNASELLDRLLKVIFS